MNLLTELLISGCKTVLDAGGIELAVSEEFVGTKEACRTLLTCETVKVFASK